MPAEAPEPGKCPALSWNGWTHYTCGRPVKGEAPRHYIARTGEGDRDEMIPVCGLHAAAWRRREANDARRAEKERIRRERYDREAEATRAATETLERIKPYMEDLGIHPATVKVDKGNLSLPAETVEMLVDRSTWDR
jgi:hypothetical protein